MITCFRGLVRDGVDRNQLDAEFEAAYDDRQKWQAMMGWIRTALSASDKYKDANQGVSVQTVMQIAQMQIQHEAGSLRAEIDKSVQDEVDDLENSVKRRIRRTGLFTALAFVAVILWMNFQYVAAVLTSLFLRMLS